MVSLWFRMHHGGAENLNYNTRFFFMLLQLQIYWIFCFKSLLTVSVYPVFDFVADLTLNFGTLHNFLHYHPPGYIVTILFTGRQYCFIPVFFLVSYCSTHWSSILFYTCVFCCVILQYILVVNTGR